MLRGAKRPNRDPKAGNPKDMRNIIGIYLPVSLLSNNIPTMFLGFPVLGSLFESFHGIESVVSSSIVEGSRASTSCAGPIRGQAAER